MKKTITDFYFKVEKFIVGILFSNEEKLNIYRGLMLRCDKLKNGDYCGQIGQNYRAIQIQNTERLIKLFKTEFKVK